MTTTLQERFAHVFSPGSSGRTLVLFHGTGGNETSLLRFAPALLPEANVLSVRGNSLDEGYPRFFRRLAEGVFDLEDLRFRTEELADFLADAYREYGIDPAQTAAFGYSNGANIAAALWLLRPEALAQAVFARPMLPISPNDGIDLRGKQGLILAGEFDSISPIGHATDLESVLVGLGAEIEFVAQPAGHELGQSDLERAAAWLAGR